MFSARVRPLQLWSLNTPRAQADAVLLLDHTLEATPTSLETFSLGEGLLHCREKVVGKYLAVDSDSSQREAVALAGSVEWLLVRCGGDMTMIPVENLISNCRPTGTKVAVFVESAEAVNGLAFALQLGVDALVLEQDEATWASAIAARDQRAQQSVGLVEKTSSSLKEDAVVIEGRVTEVSSVGIGDRVCIDFVQLLRPGEGVWVGSCARSLALVHGEIFVSEFVPSRPFRVNSGAVHSYVLTGDGNLRYLAELKAGDRVSVFNMETRTSRDVVVGRIKLEPRPMVKVSYVSEAGAGQVFLQQAETVRLICCKDDHAHWDAVSVTNLAPDTVLYLRNQIKGTHLGKAIEADVIEI